MLNKIVVLALLEAIAICLEINDFLEYSDFFGKENQFFLLDNILLMD